MANSYYERAAAFFSRTSAKAIDVRNELDAISTGFGLLPTPRNDGEGFEAPVAVGDATESYHAASKGQLEALIVSNQQNKLDAEAAQGHSETAQGKAEEAQGRAETAQGHAETAKEQADEAVSAADQQRVYAAEYALKGANIPISAEAGGDGSTIFSAYHWSMKAQEHSLSSKASKDLAASYAAGVNLPPILAGDEKKTLRVKEDGTGFELKGAGSSDLATLLKFEAM
jgi:hypothetical protein